MKKNLIFTLGLLVLLVVPAIAKPIKYVGLGDKGVSGKFKKEVVIFQAEGDPRVRCLGCKNVRVILDVWQENEPIGNPTGTHVQFNTTKACGGTVSESPIAELSSLFRCPNCPMMTRNHPLLFVYNPNTCNGDEKIELQLLGAKCMNPTEPGCKELVVKKSWDFKASKLNKEFDEVDLQDEPLPGLAQTHRDPGSNSQKNKK